MIGPEQEVAQITGDVPVLAADRHEVVAIVHVVLNGGCEIQLFALLIVIGYFEPGSAQNLARDRLELAEQQLQQRAFAGTIGAHDTDAITTLNFDVQLANDHVIFIGDTRVFGFEYALARFVRFRDRKLGAADALATVASFRAHLFERPHPPLVARPTGFDAFADPDFFLRELAIEFRVRLRLDIELQGLFDDEIVVVSGP